MNVLKSKTMWVAGLTTLLGVVDQLTPLIPPQHASKVVVAAGVVMAVLRAITKQPLSEK